MKYQILSYWRKKKKKFKVSSAEIFLSTLTLRTYEALCRLKSGIISSKMWRNKPSNMCTYRNSDKPAHPFNNVGFHSQMPHFMIVLIIPYINLLNFSWIIKCLFFFLRNMGSLSFTALEACSETTVMPFSYFSQKTGLDVSCKLWICMKCQTLFSGENKKKKYFSMSFAEISTQSAKR